MSAIERLVRAFLAGGTRRTEASESAPARKKTVMADYSPENLAKTNVNTNILALY